MKIAISSTGKKMSDSIDPRFGRCNYFLVVDSVSNELNVLNNDDNASRSGGAGIQAAELVSSNNVDQVITGHCGPNAFKALQAADIKVFPSPMGSAKDALEMYNNGELVALEAADVEGHWK
jgi:predicted Fe-Mo cluster-binding NifX family protein